MIQPGESSFVITVRGTSGIPYSGSYLASTATAEAKSTIAGVVGTLPVEFQAIGTSVYLSVQKKSDGGQLEVEISRNGTSIKKQLTDAPFGVVTLASAGQPVTGQPRQAEYQVDGSVKFAMLTLTSETGDMEQQLVTIPFTKVFYPKAGWAVGLVAQKIRRTHEDLDGTIQVLDDGVSGSVHVAIRVNGTVLGEAEASDPHGSASATVRIP